MPEFRAETILLGNDKLTRYYTELPTYDSFVALAEYLEPKALHLQSWRRGNETNSNSANEGEVQQRGSTYLSLLYKFVNNQSFTCICNANSFATSTGVIRCMYVVHNQ